MTTACRSNRTAYQAAESKNCPPVPNFAMNNVRSLHYVRKMTQCGSSALRKTVIILIEPDD